MARLWWASILFALHGVALAQPAPTADHHQHVFGPNIVALLGASGSRLQPISTDEVIALLDAAGIRKAVLLSVAYLYATPGRNVEDEFAKVRAENDWTAQEAAKHPDRLRAFCGVNPLKEYALEEIARCARHPGLRQGLKLHLGNADVQLEKPEHAEQLARVFRAANEHRMAIVVHMRASFRNKRAYGTEQARVFVEKLLAAAPDIMVQVAHMAGAGPGYDDAPAHEVMGFLADAAARRDPRMRNVWFDVASIVDRDISPGNAKLLAGLIRKVGVERVVYGSDAAAGDNLRPREAWAAFLKLPLTPEEFTLIARNEAPYLR
jgi:predicted TIM-barrel fold metal-dependent hydrolase